MCTSSVTSSNLTMGYWQVILGVFTLAYSPAFAVVI